MVDIKFVDTFGTWQHFSCPISENYRGNLRGRARFFDGFQHPRLEKASRLSDMLAMPDPNTAFIDPFFCAVPTLSLTCTIAETGTKEPYSRDPRAASPSAPNNI